MRIIAGKYRGKKLFTPDTMKVRPTAERAREALFNILYSRLGDMTPYKVLDVFAGTGSFGLEALSRGAQAITLIDIDPKIVKKNVALFPADKDKITVIEANALKLPFARQSHNILFTDAPYAQGLSESAICELVNKNWLDDGALCMIETRHDETLNLPENFLLVDERLYGLAKIYIYIFKKE